jgi:uncharacterized protein (TIGR03435 family)
MRNEQHRTLDQHIYGLLLRLHRPAFRDEFAEEMALDFAEARESHGVLRLYLDALASAARQWTVYAFSTEAPPQPVSGRFLLDGRYGIIDADRLTPFELLRGSAASAALIAVLALVPMRAPKNPLFPANPAGIQGEVPAGTRSVQTANDDDGASPGGRRTATVIQPGFRPATADELSTQAAEVASATALRISGVPLMRGVQMVVAPFPAKRFMYGQILHAAAPLPSFEVVSIRPWEPKPSPPPPPPTPNDTNAPPKSSERIVPFPGGQKTDRVHTILPANLLITFAYGLPPGFENRVLGAPAWAGSDQYEIQAKIPDALFAKMQTMTPAEQREQVALMEQSLLADRFKMKAHFETREMPVYALVIAKGGAKLTPAKDGESIRLSVVNVDGGFKATAVAVSLDELIHSPFLGGRAVVDQTGLNGAYDFELTWRRPQPVVSDTGQDSGADQPPLFTALQEQLGLKLVQTKGQVEVIVIDHIERPSPN